MNISVLNVKSKQIDGKQVCVEVHALFSLVDGETGLKYRLAEEIKLGEPSDDQFIDYDAVTEETVNKWIVDALSEQKVDAESDVTRYEQIRASLEAGLAKMIESKQVISGLPWSSDVDEQNMDDPELDSSSPARGNPDS